MKRLKAVLLVLLLSFSIFATEGPTIALVLSGGGSRGIPEIPILAELDRRGIYPDYILGTSMGSLIGGLYSIGYTPEELVDVVKNGNIQGKVFNVFNPVKKKLNRAYETANNNILNLDFNLEQGSFSSANALFDDQYVNGFIRTLIAKVMDVRDFDDFSIPFRAIGANLQNGKKIVFKDGPLFDALRGSMSLPVLFPPLVTKDGVYVVDGGTVDNLPVDDARALGADIIIAVDVNEDVANYGSSAQNLESLSGATLQYSVIITQNIVKKNLSKADYVLIPKTRNLSIMDFTKVDEYLLVGEECVDENLAFFDKLEAVLTPYLPKKERVLYRDLPYLNIEKIEYPKELERFKDYIKAFEGRVATESTIEEFEALLDSIRIKSHLKNINYRVENGVYTLEIIPFATLSNTISLGLEGDCGLLFNAFSPSYFTGYFNSTLAMNVHFDFKKVALDLDFEYGQGLMLASTLSVPFLKHDYFLSTMVGYGYFTPFGYRKSLNQFKNSNSLIEAETGFRFATPLQARLDLYIDAGFVDLGKDLQFGGKVQNIWPYDNLFYTLAHLDYNYKERTFRTKETRYYEQSFAISLGFSSAEGLVYGIRYDGIFFVPLIPRYNGIYFELNLTTLHLPRALAKSYVPNLFYSLVEQKIAFNVGYRQYFNKGGKLFYKFECDSEITSEHYDGNIVPSAMERTLIPFSKLSNFEMAVCGGIGIAINDTDVTFFAKIGLHGDMSIYLEIK